MRWRTLWGGLGVALSLCLQACAGAKAPRYEAAPDEVLYGTWLNVEKGAAKSVTTPGKWIDYSDVAESAVVAAGTEEIILKWIDEKGDTWYRTHAVVTYCAPATSATQCTKGTKAQQLHRFRADGQFREWMHAVVETYSSMNYPKEIDPRSANYHACRRAPG